MTGDDLTYGRELIDITEIERARASLPDAVVMTPLLRWDRDTWLKPENIQPTGSFKIRGASARLASISARERARGVVAYSSGNHGQAVARAARIFDTDAVIVVPSNAPLAKATGIMVDGARIVRCGPASEERKALAEEIAETTGRTLIPPYDDREVIAGQGTIGLELAAQMPGLENVVVPVGGGGLMSGVATAVKTLNPDVKITGVEPEFAADAGESFRTGRIVTWPEGTVAKTIADGLRTQSLSPLTFRHIRRHVDDIFTVSEDEIRAATALLAVRAHLVVEPSGALALAAHLTGRLHPSHGRALILTGGNVDPDSLDRILRSTRRHPWLALPKIPEATDAE